MASKQTDEATQGAWRALGFYYDRDDSSKTWRIIGSACGLRGLAEAVRQYTRTPANARLGEHKHFGPYAYLEIGTAARPEITDHWIAGPLTSLVGLADLIDRTADASDVGGRVSLRNAFSPESTFDLVLEVREPGFDPATADPLCQP